MPAPITLDADQLAQYRTDGFVVLGTVVDEDERRALLEVEARFRPGSRHPERRPFGLLVREQLCDRSEAVRRFCTAGAHLPVLAQLLGPDVAFTHTQFITKLPELPHDGAPTAAAGAAASGTAAESDIPLHQDDGYGTLDPPLDVTVWTALTDADDTTGGLVIVPGSHLGGLVEHRAAAANPFLREATGSAPPAIAVTLRAGEAVAFSGLTLHGSGPNRGDAPRVGMHARYCHPSVRMVTQGDRPVLEDPRSWMVLGAAGGA